MKKVIFAIFAIAAMTFTACTSKNTESDATTTDSTTVVTDSTDVMVDSTSVDSTVE